MQSLTENEAKIVDFLIRNFRERNSINEIGRKIKISHTGAHKILRKLEKIKAVKPDRIGNAIYYKPNLDNELGLKLAEYVLAQNELIPYSEVQADDLRPLREIASSCILFGSVLSKGKEARDIDVMLVVEEKDFKKLYKKLEEIKEMSPKKIHDVMQSREDIAKNIKKNDEVILDIIKNGRILWGSEIIVEAIKNGTS